MSTIGPIIRRELMTTLRTRQAWALQATMVIALGVLIGVRWPAGAKVDLDGAAAREVQRVFGYGLMVGLILLAPVFPATTIVREKVQGTLALLLNSPLRPWSIVVGKLVGVLGFVFLLVLLSCPAAAACFAMGGVALNKMGLLYLVLILLTIQYAALGLLISTYATSTDSALRLTYGVILLLSVVTLGPYKFLGGQVWISTGMASALDWLRSISPIPAMAEVLGDTNVGSSGLATTGSVTARFCVLALLSIFALTFWTCARMNMHILDRARAAGQVTDERSRSVQLFRRVMYLWFFDPQRRSGMIGRWTNPVMVKEQRSRRFGRSNWMMRLIAACLIVSLLLMLAAATASKSEGVAAMGGIMVLLQVCLILLLTPSLAAGLISGEIESRGWQLLQTTPMSAWTIVAGKLLSVTVTLVLVLLATLPAYAMLIYIDPGQWQIASYVLVTLMLIALLALLLSMAVSSLFANTAAATATSYALLIALCGGTLLFWLGENAPFSHELVQKVLLINPLAAALTLIEAPGFRNYNLVPANWIIVGLLCAWCLSVLVFQVWRLTKPR